MQEFLQVYGGQAIYSVVVFAVGYLYSEIKKTRHDSKLVKSGVCCLLRDRIIHKYDKCMAAGFCPVAYLTDIEEMERVYTALGGNGIVKNLLEKVKALPTEPPHEVTA